MCVCLFLCIGVNCSIKLGYVGRIVFDFFYYYHFSVQRACGTLKQNLVKFLTALKSLSMMSTISIILRGYEIAQISDFLVGKYKALLYLKKRRSFQTDLL